MPKGRCWPNLPRHRPWDDSAILGHTSVGGELAEPGPCRILAGQICHQQRSCPVLSCLCAIENCHPEVPSRSHLNGQATQPVIKHAVSDLQVMSMVIACIPKHEYLLSFALISSRRQLTEKTTRLNMTRPSPYCHAKHSRRDVFCLCECLGSLLAFWCRLLDPFASPSAQIPVLVHSCPQI